MTVKYYNKWNEIKYMYICMGLFIALKGNKVQTKLYKSAAIKAKDIHMAPHLISYNYHDLVITHLLA